MMNAEKLKRLQAQVRIGGKGTARRKKKVMHQTAATDDKKLQSSLKKLSVSTIPGIEEVNIIKDDLSVIHFNNPKAQASLSANTFAVAGHGENKKIVEMLPEILPQLGQETVVQLRCFANCLSNNQKGLSSVAEEDDVPTLVSDFDEASKHEVDSLKNNVEKTINDSIIKNQKNNKGGENLNIKKNVDSLVDGQILKEIKNASDTALSPEILKQQISSNKGKSSAKSDTSSKNKDKKTSAEAKENKKSKKQDKLSNKSAVKKAGEELISATAQLLAEMAPNNTNTKTKEKKSPKNQELLSANNIKNLNVSATANENEKNAISELKKDSKIIEKTTEQKNLIEKPKIMKDAKPLIIDELKSLEDGKITKPLEALKDIISAPVPQQSVVIDSGNKGPGLTDMKQTSQDVKKTEKIKNIVEQQKVIQPVVVEKSDGEKTVKNESLKQLEVSNRSEELKPNEQTAPKITKSSDEIKLPEFIQTLETMKSPLSTLMDESMKSKSAHEVTEKIEKAAVKSPEIKDKKISKSIELEKSKNLDQQQSKTDQKTVDSTSNAMKSVDLSKNLDSSKVISEKPQPQELQSNKPLGVAIEKAKDLPNKKDEIKPLEVADKNKQQLAPTAVLPKEAVSFSEAAKLNLNTENSELVVKKVPEILEVTKIQPETKPNETKIASQSSDTVQKPIMDIKNVQPVTKLSDIVSNPPKSLEIAQETKKSKSPDPSQPVTKKPTELKESPKTLKPSNDDKSKVSLSKPNKNLTTGKVTESKETKIPVEPPIKETIVPASTDKGKIIDGTVADNITIKSPKKPTETKKTASNKQEDSSIKTLEVKPLQEAKKPVDQINKPKQSKQSSPVPPAITTANVNTSSSSPVKQQKPSKQPVKLETVQPKQQTKPSSSTKQTTPNKSPQQLTVAKPKQMSPPKILDAVGNTKKTPELAIDNKMIQKETEIKPLPPSTSGKQSSPKPRATAKPQQQQQQQQQQQVKNATKPLAQDNTALQQQQKPVEKSEPK